MKKNQHIVTLCGKGTLNCIPSLINKKVKISYQDGNPKKLISQIGIFVDYQVINFAEIFEPINMAKSLIGHDINKDTYITYSIKDNNEGVMKLLISYYDQIFIEELSDNPNDFGSAI